MAIKIAQATFKNHGKVALHINSFPLPNSIPSQLHRLGLMGFYPRLRYKCKSPTLSKRELPLSYKD